LPGSDKPFEQLTISELVQLRPGSAGQDAGNYNVEAVGSDATISTSSALSQLAQSAGDSAVKQELAAAQVRNIFTAGNVLGSGG